MAEAVMRHYVRQAGLEAEYEIASAAVSNEEWGNPIYPPAARTLREHGIPYDKSRTARQMTAADYDRYDIIVGMDEGNIRGINRIAGGDPSGKVHLLMDFAGQHRAVADPWYTRDFETAFADIDQGCRALCQALVD